MFVNSRHKATKIIGQRKAFYRQSIPESSCVRKETFYIDILVTSRNGDTKILGVTEISCILGVTQILFHISISLNRLKIER